MVLRIWDTSGIYVPMVLADERQPINALGTTTRRVTNVGVVTCVAVEAADEASSAGEIAEHALVKEGAAVVMPTGVGLVAAYRRVTDAVRAALVLRTHFPTIRVAVCTGETGAHGEFGTVADKASTLLSAAHPGSTLLSKLAGALAMDHLPRDRTLRLSGQPDGEPCYELLDVVLSA